MPNTPKVVLIGGGTGSFTILQALKNRPISVTALVNMADDGGSTGVLRDELGVLPPGDIRQCLVALSDAPEELRELFNFRFPNGTFEGHSFGNIFLSAVETMTSDFNNAVRIAGDILHIRGQVLPITLENCQLVMKADGKEYVGENVIGNTVLPVNIKPELYLTPNARLTDPARDAILAADLVVIAPGNLYASLAPALLASGLGDALDQTRATVAYVCNLVNKPTHTADFAVHDYVSEIERFIGRPVIDYVLYNIDYPSEELLDKYAVEGEYPVDVDESALASAAYESVSGHFLSHEVHKRDPNDTFIKRSLIRHDSEAVADMLVKLIPPSPA